MCILIWNAYVHIWYQYGICRYGLFTYWKQYLADVGERNVKVIRFLKMHLADPISPLFKSPFKLLKATWKMMQGVCSQQCWPASKQRTNCAQLKKSIQPKNSFELECQELVWLSNFPSNKSGLEDWGKVKIFVFSNT